MLYYLPLEPLEERYTEQWYRWFPEEFERQGLEYQIIDGEPLLENEIKVGTFLDINSTIAYKAHQIRQVASLFFEGKVKSGDSFFLADTEMFGLEATIRYLADLNQIQLKIFGFAHAGSYTFEDFVQKCSSYANHYEQAWAHVFDKIFVGTAYHRDQLCNLRLGNHNYSKVEVTGNPYRVEEEKRLIGLQEKKMQVIHTNRPDPEKRPSHALLIFEALKKKHPDWNFVVTTSRKQWGEGELRDFALELQRQGTIEIKENLTKKEYLTEVAQSRVLTGNSIEENFGYCILEAMIFDTIPIIEDNYSHPELVQKDQRCLFGGASTQMCKIEQAMAEPFAVSHYADRYENSLGKIVEMIK